MGSVRLLLPNRVLNMVTHSCWFGTITPTHNHIKSTMGRVESHNLRALVQSTILLARPPHTVVLELYSVESRSKVVCPSEERKLVNVQDEGPHLCHRWQRHGGGGSTCTGCAMSRCDEPVRARRPEGLFGMCYMTFFWRLKTVYVQEICTELTLGTFPLPVLYFEVFHQTRQTQEEICKNSQNGVYRWVEWIGAFAFQTVFAQNVSTLKSHVQDISLTSFLLFGAKWNQQCACGSTRKQNQVTKKNPSSPFQEGNKNTVRTINTNNKVPLVQWRTQSQVKMH